MICLMDVTCDGSLGLYDKSLYPLIPISLQMATISAILDLINAPRWSLY